METGFGQENQKSQEWLREIKRDQELKLKSGWRVNLGLLFGLFILLKVGGPIVVIG